MNFGLTILAIFYIVFLVVPGVFFKRFYFQSKFGGEFHSGAFADKIITSIFWGIIIQLFVLTILKTTFEISFDVIYTRCRNVYSDIQNNKLPAISYFQLKAMLGLLAGSSVIACFLGHILHKIIRFLKLDVKYTPLRFSNDWNYIFRNELYGTRTSEDFLKKSYYSTEVDILVNDGHHEKPNFYQGVLQDYFLDEKGDLDRISLSGTCKRVKDSENKDIYLPVSGHTFIVPYKNISNLNLRFNYIEKNTSVLPAYIRGALSIILLFSFLILMIAPWFSEVSLFSRFVSIIFLFFSWAFFIAAISDWLNDKPSKSNDWSFRLVFFALFFISLFGGLYILDVFNLIEYIITCFNTLVL